MDETAARDMLAAMVGVDDTPALTAPEFEALVTLAKTRDAYNLRPSDSGWEPTWDLNRAAARGWKIKAGKIASQYAVSGGGQSLSREQWFDHCIEMVKQYQTGSIGTIWTGSAGGAGGWTDVIGNINVN